ncbi:MAG: hypothetical protein WDA60_12115 [Acidimicrobiia bacterium]|jgi:hypothetical protein
MQGAEPRQMQGADPSLPVTVVDRVTLPRSDADAWIARLHRRYRPGAEARGFTLTRVAQTRAAQPHAVEIVVEWALPDVRAFWRSRAGGHDPSVAEWWATTDALALARTRSVMGPT